MRASPLKERRIDMDSSVNGPQKMGNLIIEEVWYDGTDQLRQGEAVCYNVKYGEAAKFDGRRCNRVTRPSVENNNAFAGVLERDYSAKPSGQRVRICVPGSKGAVVALGADTVTGQGTLTFQVGGGSGAGRFVKAGYSGRGTIVPRQTVSAVLESGMTGGWSLATDGVTLTVSDTTGIVAGDTVVLLGGEDEGDSKAVIADKYAVSSVSDGTTLVLARSAVGATPGAALTCTGYVYSGNPVCQADMMTGHESGGIEFVSPPNTGDADGTGLSFMQGGVTFICGGVTIATENANGVLQDGNWFGQAKGFCCLGDLATKDAQVSLATAGIQATVNDSVSSSADGSPMTLISAAFDGAGDFLHLLWWGLWCEQVHAGCTLSDA